MNEISRLQNMLDDIREAKAYWVDLLDCYNACADWFNKYKKEKADCKARIETYNVMEQMLKSALWDAQHEEKES